jgi:hypothetical protein
MGETSKVDLLIGSNRVSLVLSYLRKVIKCTSVHRFSKLMF